MRFALASLVFLPAALQKIGKTKLAIKGLLTGAVISIGYIGQGIGLETSTADKAAFLCTLQIVWVALVQGVISKNFKLQTWVSVALALVGTALLEFHGSIKPVIGDAWLLLQPLGFGSGYIFLENVVQENPDDSTAITGFKLLGVAICMVIWMFYDGNTMADIMPIADSPLAMAGFGYCAFITTAGAIYAQSLAFKRVSAADASIIIASEPVWAAIIGFIILGETLTRSDLFGGFLIILAGLSYELNLLEKLGKSLPEKDGKI